MLYKSNHKLIFTLICFIFDDDSLTGKPVGETVLYFGCRNKAIDYLYENELNAAKDSGLLKVRHLAHCCILCIYSYID